jgi:hypothetical protein
LIREEQLGLLEGLVLKVLEQRFQHNVTGARAVSRRTGDGDEVSAASVLGERAVKRGERGKEAGRGAVKLGGGARLL